ncbi:hypothetical protein [Paenibacillus odorifer]|uniref:hypothetical protein n=1 Tax=Paenibacillus odorifer TaxID=189426 RepID=UPI00096F23E1|nr:hypothetical protein [Paenibacillus odorifer]OMD76869.1 hypothetical protein BSK50_14040 [Paenibacillus odorifer]
MNKYQAIEKYETRINELEKKRDLVLSTLQDSDVSKHSNYVMKNIADLNIEIQMYIDVIETINSLEFA